MIECGAFEGWLGSPSLLSHCMAPVTSPQEGLDKSAVFHFLRVLWLEDV